MVKAVDLPALAAWMRMPSSTLRCWARRENWQVVGYDAEGRQLYDFYKVRDILQERRPEAA